MDKNYYGGYYKVEHEKFESKILACLKASELKKPMTWHFHDQTFSKTNTIKDIDLKDLYRQRALQLREKYDYLILNYSGGSDSWTVLNTFLENNIKLDHIFVKWPVSAMDKGFYKPNRLDRSGFNFVSEWDFTLKKDLKWLSQSHPKIKIEIGDYLENSNEKYFSDILIQQSRFYKDITNLLRVNYISPTEKNLANKGVKVGSIYGVDKPNLLLVGSKLYFYFIDSIPGTCPPQLDNLTGTEYFYWTPDLPEIVTEQSYKIYKFYKLNKEKQHLLLSLDLNNIRNHQHVVSHLNRYFEESSDIIRKIIYPDWDFSKFQAYKSVMIPDVNIKQHDYWLANRQEMLDLQPAWKYYLNSYIDKIDPVYFLPNGEFKKSRSRLFYIGDLNLEL